MTAVTAVVLLLAPVPFTVRLMADPQRAPQEFALGAVLRRDSASDRALSVLRTFETERAIAAYLDRLKLPDGSVLVDTSSGFAVVAASRRPKQFVITSDSDFVLDLNDPGRYGVRYLLAVPDEGRGTSDAINRRYPTMYDTGSSIAHLVLGIPQTGADQLPWRLYAVDGGSN